MRHSPSITVLLFAASLTLGIEPARAQQAHDSVAVSTAAPPWRDSVRYGDGPSVGAPLSDYTGKTPPTTWCLRATRRAPGDFGRTGQSWNDISRSWLRQMLSDTTEWGAVWRKVLGGAPVLAPGDSIVQITDEEACHTIAKLLNRELLGWQVGPPPVVVFRVRDYLVAYPSNARMGEFGYAVGMTLQHEIRGVATW